MGFSSRLDAFIRWRSPKASESKMTEIETHLKELGWALPDPPTPVGAYLLSRQSGDLGCSIRVAWALIWMSSRATQLPDKPC
jgi:hypothetical protein